MIDFLAMPGLDHDTDMYMYVRMYTCEMYDAHVYMLTHLVHVHILVNSLVCVCRHVPL